MGDANKEIAFGTVATALLAAGAVGGISHAVDPEGPSIRNALLAAVVGGIGGAAYFWHEERTPGSWVNPILRETVQAPSPGTSSAGQLQTSVVANPNPPTPLGTTVALIETLGTVAGVLAALGVVYEWQQRRSGAIQ